MLLLVSNAALVFNMNNLKPDILKSGAIILDDQKRLLIVKPKKNKYWIFVGGKLEAGETPEQSLVRELKEELNVAVNGELKFYMESPVEPAAGDSRGRTIQIYAYFASILGEPQPNSEIEILHWLSLQEYKAGKYLLGSILNNHVIPRLIEDGLID